MFSAEDKDLEEVHRRLRQKAAQFLQMKANSSRTAKDNAQRLLDLQNQNDNVRHIHYGCDRVNEMLEDLEESTKAEDPMQLMGQAPAYKPSELHKQEETDEVLALRAFASDDTTLETTSVADYAADPPPPMLFSASCIEESMNSIAQSIEKISQSNEVVSRLVRENPHWWNSAIVVRRLKTHTIRMNYHARKVRLWGDQNRSHLFVNSSIINQVASEATQELRDLKAKTKATEIKKGLLTQQSKKLEEENTALVKEFEGLKLALSPINEAIALIARSEYSVVSNAVADEQQMSPEFELALLLAKLNAVLEDSRGKDTGSAVQYQPASADDVTAASSFVLRALQSGGR